MIKVEQLKASVNRMSAEYEREAEREAMGSSIPLADQKPPHW